MSALDRFLRGLAFIAYMFTFMGILTLETFLRPLYYPIFGEKIKKKKGFEPYQILTRWFAKTFNSIFAIRVEGFGLNNAKGIEPCIVMFTHGSNYDSVAINTVLPIYLNYIAKKSLFKIPLIGYLLKQIGTIPIDRANRDSAIHSLDDAAKLIKTQKKNISISPEGTRRRRDSITDPHVSDFKKGPFHLAKAVNVNILPVLIFGAHRLWPPGQLFPSSGTVLINVLPVISNERVEKMTVDELLTEVKGIFDKNLIHYEEKMFELGGKKPCFIFYIFLAIFFLSCFFTYYGFYLFTH